MILATKCLILLAYDIHGDQLGSAWEARDPQIHGLFRESNRHQRRADCRRLSGMTRDLYRGEARSFACLLRLAGPGLLVAFALAYPRR
jgi:hypothetical protein